MAAHPSAEVQNVAGQVAAHMDEIKKLFKPDAKITVLVRSTAVTDHSRDILITEDTIVEVIAALQARMSKPTLTGAV